METLWQALLIAGEATGLLAAYTVTESLTGNAFTAAAAAGAYLAVGTPLTFLAYRSIRRRSLLASRFREACRWNYYRVWGGTSRHYCIDADGGSGVLSGLCLNPDYGLAGAFRGKLVKSEQWRPPWDYSCVRPLRGWSAKASGVRKIFHGFFQVPAKKGHYVLDGVYAEIELDVPEDVKERLSRAAEAIGLSRGV